MKKSFIAITFVFSMIFVSCASKDAPVIETVPEAPAVDEIEITQTEESESEETYEELSITENETEDSLEDYQEENAEIEVSEIEELEEIDEPVVITLEPEFIPEPEEIEEAEEIPEPEQIEVETPPVIEDIPDVESTGDETTESEDNLKQNDTDDVIDVADELEADDSMISIDEQDTIDITEDNSENTIDSELVTEEIIPSRKVTMKKQEYVDISYPGTGWIFMGLTDGSKDLSYFGRKLGTSDTKFTLQARNAGTKIVHFYKNDSLTNQYIDDYVEIEILPEKGSNKNHVEAPAYKQPVPKKAKEILEKQETSKVENAEEPVVISAPEPQSLKEISPPPVPVYTSEQVPEVTQEISEIKNEAPDTNLLLKEAKLLYNENEYKAALDKLNLFFEFATTKRDEALFLQGQILESKSEVQNIKAAMESYTTLTKNYPASKYWDDANKRIIYLKRFYFGG